MVIIFSQIAWKFNASPKPYDVGQVLWTSNKCFAALILQVIQYDNNAKVPTGKLCPLPTVNYINDILLHSAVFSCH